MLELSVDTIYKSIVVLCLAVIAIVKFIQAVDSGFSIFKKYSIKEAMHNELEECKKELKLELDTCKNKLDEHANLLQKDNEHFKEVDKSIKNIQDDIIDMQKVSDGQFTIIVKTMLALVNYSIDPTKKDNLEKAQEDLTTFLIAKNVKE